MDQNTDKAIQIMTEFAERTGLSSDHPPKRYVWTDAFAVCNFLALYRRTHDETFKDLALRLVDQVHHVLGKHREDDPRTGWISGLAEADGEKHPTRGGLRIGKKLNERKPDEPFDDRLEWDREGQYYHYLTRWMHALNRVSRATGEVMYNNWAIELARNVHDRFTYTPSSGGPKRMYWKMSIDLSRPLVPSMGHHDPLDGFITYQQIQTTAVKLFNKPPESILNREIADMATICEGRNWATDDPLGLGGLLSDACRVTRLIIKGSFSPHSLLETLLDASLTGLNVYARQNHLELPADYRLAFRELGLSIGLRGVAIMDGLIGENPTLFASDKLALRVASLKEYLPMVEKVEEFWLKPENREARSWTEHVDINSVMLATSLVPDGYLRL